MPRFSSPGDRVFSRYFYEGATLRGPWPSTALVEGSDLRAFRIWEAEHAGAIYVRDKRPGRWRYAAGMAKAGRPVSALAVQAALDRAGLVEAGAEPGDEWERGASSRTATARAIEACDLAHEALGLPVHPRLRELLDRGDLDRVVVWKTTRRKYDGHRWIEYPLAQPMRVRDIVRELVQQAQRIAAQGLGA